jgi:hypothetical protein
MSDDIEIVQSIAIREANLDEYWLQDQIYDNPECLGLGELESIGKEKQQSSGGRLDLLLKDPADDSMYEVEVMLGDTNETHIIRTIEYWDNEKRKWPQRQHYAVLVAEHINRRFFNVIHLLSHSIPIIAIQVSLLEMDAKKRLFFTTVLDTYEEVDDGTSVDGGRHTREDWIRKAKEPLINCAKQAYWRLRFGGRRRGCAAELCVVGLCGQEETHEARRFSGRDGGGRAVAGAGSAH